MAGASQCGRGSLGQTKRTRHFASSAGWPPPYRGGMRFWPPTGSNASTTSRRSIRRASSRAISREVDHGSEHRSAKEPRLCEASPIQCPARDRGDPTLSAICLGPRRRLRPADPQGVSQGPRRRRPQGHEDQDPAEVKAKEELRRRPAQGPKPQGGHSIIIGVVRPGTGADADEWRTSIALGAQFLNALSQASRRYILRVVVFR